MNRNLCPTCTNLVIIKARSKCCLTVIVGTSRERFWGRGLGSEVWGQNHANWSQISTIWHNRIDLRYIWLNISYIYLILVTKSHLGALSKNPIAALRGRWREMVTSVLFARGREFAKSARRALGNAGGALNFVLTCRVKNNLLLLPKNWWYWRGVPM